MKTNFNLDRNKISSENINARQNFKKVLEGYHKLKPPIYKNPWFYGAAGLASIAMIISLTLYSSDREESKKETILSASNVTTSDLEDTHCIKPISEMNDLAFNVYAIDPSKGGNILLPSGTEIRIHAKSLVTNSSSPVELRIREFQNKEDAFVAGIPMDQGKNNAFESAGMLEIRANQNGMEVAINEERPIEVSMSLYKNPVEFKFWYLNESSKKWKEHEVQYSNEDLSDHKSELKKAEHTLELINKKIDVCNETITELSTPVTENSLIPTLGSRKLQIDFEEVDFPELKGYKEIEFEYLNYSEEVSKTLKSQVWNNVSLKKAGDYIAVFSNSKGSQSVKVRPVLKGKSLQEVENQLKEAEVLRQKEMAKQAADKESLQKRALQLQAKYNGMVADMQQELNNSFKRRNQVTNASQSLNSIVSASADFRVTRFGIYNCDKPIPYPPSIEDLLAFTDENGNDLQPASVHVFDLKKDCRYSFGRTGEHNLSEIGWYNNPTTIVLMDKEGRIFVGYEVEKKAKQVGKISLKKIDEENVANGNLSKLIRETPTA